jgi:hypothetical protein
MIGLTIYMLLYTYNAMKGWAEFLITTEKSRRVIYSGHIVR